MSLLSVTDLINILFVDVPGVPSDEDGGVAAAETEQTTIVLPSAGE